MDKSFDVLKNLPNDTEWRFFDCFGNIVDAANTFASCIRKHPEVKEDIERAKQEFQKKLKEFENSGYTPQGKINPESIKKLHEFEDLDWTNEEVMQSIKDHLGSLYPEK